MNLWTARGPPGLGLCILVISSDLHSLLPTSISFESIEISIPNSQSWFQELGLNSKANVSLVLLKTKHDFFFFSPIKESKSSDVRSCSLRWEYEEDSSETGYKWHLFFFFLEFCWVSLTFFIGSISSGLCPLSNAFQVTQSCPALMTLWTV